MAEIYLSISVLVLLSVFVFFSSNLISSGRLLGLQMNYVSIFSLMIMSILYLQDFWGISTLLTDAITRDPISLMLVLFVMLGCILILGISLSYLARTSLHEYEFGFIILLVLLGLCLVIFSNDFLSLYLGIELQSLGLYVLATIKNNSTFSTESGLKYFVLGAFASTLLIFGITFFYGITGLLNFDDFLLFNLNIVDMPLNIVLGLIVSATFIFSSLIFKIGGAPFHMWVPDVYEGATSIVTAFFALVPKIGILSIFIKFSHLFFYGIFEGVSSLLLYSAILSSIIGVVGALGQYKIKRILSFSAIAHSGLILYGLSLSNFEGLFAVLLYIIVYFTLIAQIFGSFLGGQQYYSNSMLKLIGNLGLLYQSNKILGISCMIALFSMAGIPPLSGFFSKLVIFLAGIKEGYLLVSLLLIVVSAGGAIYYLRLIREMFFLENKRYWVLFNSLSKNSAYLVSFFLLFNITFVWWSSFILYSVYNIGIYYMF